MKRHRAEDYAEKFWSDHDKEEYECPDYGNDWSESGGFEVPHIDGNVGNTDDDNLIALC